MTVIPILDVALFAALSALFVYLFTRRRYIENSDRGYIYLVIGFGLTVFGAAVNVEPRDPREPDLRYIRGSEDMSPEEIQEAAETYKSRVERQASAE